MRLLCEKIRKLNIGWNESRLTESDFYRLCRRFHITVTEMPLATSGFYYRVKGQDFIALDSRLAGPRRLFVMFHELGHFLLHVPDTGATANFHEVGRRTRKEQEADDFAACAILPRTLIDRHTPEELIDEGFDAELVRQRYLLRTEKGM